MPRLVGFGDWQDRAPYTRLEYMNASTKLTSQGVRDLNGPNANGRGYNGHRSASCAHHRAPDLTPTHVTSRIVRGDRDEPEAIRSAYFTCCSLCGIELYENT